LAGADKKSQEYFILAKFNGGRLVELICIRASGAAVVAPSVALALAPSASLAPWHLFGLFHLPLLPNSGALP